MTTRAQDRDRAVGPGASSRLGWLPSVSLRGLYYAAVILAGLGIFVTQAPALEGNLLALTALIALEIALSMMPVRIYGETNVYVSFVVTLVIMAQFGVPGVVILAPLDAVRTAIARRAQSGEHDVRVFTQSAS